MKKQMEKRNDANNAQDSRHRVRLPRFITEEEIGFGDVIKRSTAYFGIKPCGSCGRRADALNRWLVFTDRQSK